MVTREQIGNYEFVAQTTYYMYVAGNETPALTTSDIVLFERNKNIARSKIKTPIALAGRHTPGPWFYDQEDRRDLEIRTADRRLVAEACDTRSFTVEQCQANAKLIAASPELLEYLNDCVKNIMIDFADDDPRKVKYKAVIDKATK